MWGENVHNLVHSIEVSGNRVDSRFLVCIDHWRNLKGTNPMSGRNRKRETLDGDKCR